MERVSRKAVIASGIAAMSAAVSTSFPAMADTSQEVRPGVGVRQVIAATIIQRPTAEAFKWDQASRSAIQPTAASGVTLNTAQRWEAFSISHRNVSPTGGLAGTPNATAAEGSGFKWGLRSASEQQGFKWGLRSASEQQGFKWGLR
jgi:hypothetical protein